MPIYRYRCGSCYHEFEEQKVLKDSDVLPEACPVCTSDEIEKVIGGTQFIGTKQKGYYNSKVMPVNKQHYSD